MFIFFENFCGNTIILKYLRCFQIQNFLQYFLLSISENKKQLLDLFLRASPIASLLGRFLNFKVNFVTEQATFSKVKLLSACSKISRLVTTLEKEKFRVCSASLSFKMILIFSINVNYSSKPILSEWKCLTVFHFFCLDCHNTFFRFTVIMKNKYFVTSHVFFSAFLHRIL